MQTSSLALPNPFIVTIDGGARTGTSSSSRLLASRLGVPFLDSGALYRTITLLSLEEGVDVTDVTGLIKIAQNSAITFKKLEGSTEQSVYSGDRDVTNDIRGDIVTQSVSSVALHPEIRDMIMPIQRSVGTQLVSEGRDMGTTVFPHAQIKFFFEAEYPERARRHQKYLIEQNGGSEENIPMLEEIEPQLRARDEKDKNRDISPLKPAYDAIIIDTTHIPIEGVVDIMMQHISKIL